ncbi:hypothetical protein [Alicyclobacillus dauci]|uniref:Sporulation protein YtfJ (Spore_YtfJ) n=1 Tax=Alicyclobacillus dauci TaxID=1475485 RepID=A0ABY6Z108_9BACL|nr:hypothetical protein [Alicyclobacillus dauci]WAH36415.1 hypothetical protein NZD86_19685 [Alicyclobacillus dauci]
MTINVAGPLQGMVQGVQEAVQVVLPFPVVCNPVESIEASILQPEMGVLVGVTGDVRGRLVLEAPVSVFSFISMSMFGMQLEGEMLESFVGVI